MKIRYKELFSFNTEIALSLLFLIFISLFMANDKNIFAIILFVFYVAFVLLKNVLFLLPLSAKCYSLHKTKRMKAILINFIHLVVYTSLFILLLIPSPFVALPIIFYIVDGYSVMINGNRFLYFIFKYDLSSIEQNKRK